MSERASPGRLGRFEVTGLLGEGGMGVVYAARDPDLDRLIAIKLIRRLTPHQSVRLLREAQALARLQHPNVVAVHEVGRHGDEVFVAMELVDGVSVDRLEPPPARWQDAVRLFVQAGRGLAAAHAKGLVHRDIKPHNLLVDREGRVRVADFGLVRLVSGATTEPDPAAATHAVDPEAATIDGEGTLPPGADPRGQDGALGAVLTAPDAFLGTPRYMAPEQHARRAATAASDQFSFCVALWETIFGEHPFAAETAGGNGERAPVRPGRAPRWLVAALDRGLALAPSRRHASMTALVDLLEHTPARRRRIAIAAAVVPVVAAAITVGVLARGGAAGRACGNAGAPIDAVWTKDARVALAAAFAAASPFGAEAAARVTDRLDAYATRWRDARVEACRATRAPELVDRQNRCLDDELAEVRGVVDALVHADRAMVGRAADAIAGLPSPQRCGTQLAQIMPDPDDPRAAEIRRDLATLGAMFTRGEQAEGRKLLAELLPRADALGHPGLRARVLARYTRYGEDGSPEMKAALEQALVDARRAGDRDVEATALSFMLREAMLQTDVKTIEALLPIARAAASADHVTNNTAITFEFNAAHAYRALGQTENALAACDRLAAIEAPPKTNAADCRCSMLVSARESGAAEDACRAAVAATEAEVGPHHRDTAGALDALAAVMRQLGKHAEALPLRLRARAILDVTEPPDGFWILHSDHQLGQAYASLGRHAEARAAIEHSIGVRRKRGDGPSRAFALDLSLLAETLLAAGETDAALAQMDEAVAMHERIVGAEHPQQVEMVAYRAETYYQAGRWEVAAEGYARCAEAARTAFGEDHMLVAACTGAVACALVELGRAEEALGFADRALALLVTIETDPIYTATTRLARGRALVALGKRRDGIAEIEAAAAALRAIGEPATHEVARADRALAALKK
jgi:tetratricopeptide (TPR) repeat protein